MSDDSENTRSPLRTPDMFPGLRRILWALALFFLAWLMLTQGSHLFMHNPPGENAAAKRQAWPETAKGKDDQIEQLRARIDQLEARIKTFEDVIAASPKSTGDTSAIDAKVATLQAKIDALPAPSADNAVDDQRVAQLEDKLNKQDEVLQALQTQINETTAKNTRQLTALTALATIKDAIARGEPFAAQLDQLSGLAQDNAKAQELLVQLKVYAGKDTVTLAALQSRFDAAVPNALVTEQSGTLARNLQSLVHIRKVGEQQAGADDESIFARAEAKLARGEVDACLKELSALSPAASAAFAPWVSQAQDYLNIRHALGDLQLALMQDNPQPARAAPTP